MCDTCNITFDSKQEMNRHTDIFHKTYFNENKNENKQEYNSQFKSDALKIHISKECINEDSNDRHFKDLIWNSFIQSKSPSKQFEKAEN